MPPPIVVQVIIDKPLAQGFDYLWDENLLGGLPVVGSIVEVPFGRSMLVGMVIKVQTIKSTKERVREAEDPHKQISATH